MLIMQITDTETNIKVVPTMASLDWEVQRTTIQQAEIADFDTDKLSKNKGKFHVSLYFGPSS